MSKPDNILTVKQDRFVCAYIATGNASDAYRASYGGTHVNASQKATAVLKIPKVKATIEQIQQSMREYAKMEARDVIRIWQEIATASANDIMQVKKVPCPKCPIPANKPRLTSPPDENCMACGGEGTRHINITPTDELTDGAKRLYAGAKRTKYGIDIQLRDQDAALSNIARVLGIFKEQVEITGKDGTPIGSISEVTNDPIEAARIYQEMMGK